MLAPHLPVFKFGIKHSKYFDHRALSRRVRTNQECQLASQIHVLTVRYGFDALRKQFKHFRMCPIVVDSCYNGVARLVVVGLEPDVLLQETKGTPGTFVLLPRRVHPPSPVRSERIGQSLSPVAQRQTHFNAL